MNISHRIHQMSQLCIFEMFKYFCNAASTLCVVDVEVMPEIRVINLYTQYCIGYWIGGYTYLFGVMSLPQQETV